MQHIRDFEFDSDSDSEFDHGQKQRPELSATKCQAENVIGLSHYRKAMFDAFFGKFILI